jgi:hypothetical protein
MTDFEKPFPGQRLSIPASVYSEMLDALLFIRELRNRTGDFSLSGGPAAGSVEVQNDSSEDRFTGEVLGISDVWPEPGDTSAFKFGEKIIHGVTPAAAHRGKFAVLLEPIRAGKIGRGCIAGGCPVKIVVEDENATYAEVIPGDATGLKAGSGGTARIIKKESGTGSVWAYVQLGQLPPPRFFKLTTSFSKGGTVSVRWWQVDPTTKKATVDSGNDFAATDSFDWWPDAETGTKGHAYWDVEAGCWVIDDMDCEASTTS